MVASVGMAGFPPSVRVGPAVNPEQAKYAALWMRDEYRAVAPGESWVMTFLSQARPPKNAEVIDFGAGTGRAALMLALVGGAKVTMMDFAANCLDPEVAGIMQAQPERLKFVEHDLTRLPAQNAAYGYCCDVMEHIPPQDVAKVLANILASARHCFFAISTVPDRMGALIGEDLHLTVRPATWWADQLRAVGATIHWQEAREDCCAFYCSAWMTPEQAIVNARVNVDVDTLDAQVKANLEAGWKQAEPHDRQGREVIVLCGGPSMNDHVEQIRELRAGGCALVTVNGAYQWALDRGMEPSAQVVLDAREFNARFTRPVTPYTRYLIASQAHPATLEGLPRERTLLWHSGISAENEMLARELNGGKFFPIPGGSTVVLRAIPLLRMLGFARLHLFGFDSCVRAAAHHAYAQAENDDEPLVPVEVGGKVFQAAPWMLTQAQEFMAVVGLMGDDMEMAVYGDGLIAAMIAAGAEHAKEQ